MHASRRLPAPGDRALPRPPLGDLFDHLVLQEVVFCHAQRLLEDGVLTGVCLGDLRDLLARTWLLYVQYGLISERWKTQHRDVLLCVSGPRLPRLRLYKEVIQRRQDSRKWAKAFLKHLKPRPPNRRKEFGTLAIIFAMRMIWEEYSTEPHRGGWTASGWNTLRRSHSGLAADNSRRGRDGISRTGQDGPFQRFVHDWLLTIDPGRRLPSRQSFEAVKEIMQKIST
jgi:hypothetical protein